MAGQLIRRGKRIWLVRVYLGRDGVTGRRGYHNRTVHGSKKDAQRYLNKVQREKDTGTFVEPSRQSVGEYFTRWLASIKARVRLRTFADYESLVDRYIRPVVGGERLDLLTPLKIQSLYSSLS